jgi:uroporphyrinogen decarboxylase
MDYEDLKKVEEGTSGGKVESKGSTPAGAMTLRERFRRVMFFQRVDRLPNFEFGYWAETLPAWHEQGLPKEIDDEWKAYEYFGIEGWQSMGGNWGLLPEFEYKVIREDEEHLVYLERDGSICEINKKGFKSIPHYLEFPVKDRATWKEFKKRLNPDDPGRIPGNLKELATQYQNRDYPLGIWYGSLAGIPRNWIGFENIAMMCYDDPELLEEIVETLCQVSCTVSKILPEIDFDFGCGWEDICFNSGPIISPAIYEKIILPRYQRITDLLHKHGVFIIWTDCDGNIFPLLDIFLKGGINCMFPIEVRGGSDPVAMRAKYGDKLLLQGGVCKMALLSGPKAIEAELRRIEPEVRRGGFIPHVDHRVPADVTLENYKFYLKIKRQIFNAGYKQPQYKE